MSKNLYLFTVDDSNMVTNHIVFNEDICGKSAEKFIEEDEPQWIISQKPVGPQYYPEFGYGITGDIKPNKSHLFNFDMETGWWTPKIPYPEVKDESKEVYQFCENCECWVPSKCC